MQRPICDFTPFGKVFFSDYNSLLYNLHVFYCHQYHILTQQKNSSGKRSRLTAYDISWVAITCHRQNNHCHHPEVCGETGVFNCRRRHTQTWHLY